jgi:hypothetical protein
LTKDRNKRILRKERKMTHVLTQFLTNEITRVKELG